MTPREPIDGDELVEKGFFRPEDFLEDSDDPDFGSGFPPRPRPPPAVWLPQGVDSELPDEGDQGDGLPPGVPPLC